MKNTNEFTLADALDVQREDLIRWASVLKPELSGWLYQLAMRLNGLLEDGTRPINPYLVWRGDSITGAVHLVSHTLKRGPVGELEEHLRGVARDVESSFRYSAGLPGLEDASR